MKKTMMAAMTLVALNFASVASAQSADSYDDMDSPEVAVKTGEPDPTFVPDDASKAANDAELPPATIDPKSYEAAEPSLDPDSL